MHFLWVNLHLCSDLNRHSIAAIAVAIGVRIIDQVKVKFLLEVGVELPIIWSFRDDLFVFWERNVI